MDHTARTPTRSLNILVVMDPIEKVNVDKDTTFGFMLAAQARGHRLHYCTQDQLYAQVGGRAAVRCAPVEVWHRAHEFFALGPWADATLDSFDSIWMRKDPPVDRDYLHATYLLDHAGPRTLVLNRPSGLRDANEKLYALHFSQFTPETLVTRDAARIRAWLETAPFPLIVKPVDGHGGRGVFLLQRDDRNVPSILETLSEDGRRWIMAQRYLPEAREGDKRILMLDGEPMGAILRVPRSDEHRGNIHVGGSVVRTTLTPREREMCAVVGARLRQDGLTFVGLDVIGDHITEINVTSPTGIRELLALDGIDVATAYVRHCEERVG
jgi:glutathione synthase